jgi:hypothetical protein
MNNRETIEGVEGELVCFDLLTLQVEEIDYSVTGSDGEPVTPMDCIFVKIGTNIKRFKSRTSGKVFTCVNGVTLPEYKGINLYSADDFIADPLEFEMIGNFELQRLGV